MFQEEKPHSEFVSPGFGGRGKECSPKPKGDTYAAFLCPASSVTTATSPASPLTHSHALRRQRTCCRVHTRSSPTSTCGHGRNQTRVRKVRNMRSVVCFLASVSTCLNWLSDPGCGPIPRIQSGYLLLCDSVILYQCHSGFKLLGSSSVSCDPNSRQWSPDPPTCQGIEPDYGTGHGNTLFLKLIRVLFL